MLFLQTVLSLLMFAKQSHSSHMPTFLERYTPPSKKGGVALKKLSIHWAYYFSVALKKKQAFLNEMVICETMTAFQQSLPNTIYYSGRIDKHYADWQVPDPNLRFVLNFSQKYPQNYKAFKENFEKLKVLCGQSGITSIELDQVELLGQQFLV